MDGPVELQNNESILGAFKKCISTHNVPITLQTDNRTEFKNRKLANFDLSEIFSIFLDS